MILSSVFIYLLSLSTRLNEYVIIEDNLITLYSEFGRKKLIIDIKKEIYYQKVNIKVDFTTREYIIFSMRKFSPYNNIRNKNIVNEQQIKKYGENEILLPYNKETRKYLDIKNWINVEELYSNGKLHF